jgi:hypothetical protein
MYCNTMNVEYLGHSLDAVVTLYCKSKLDILDSTPYTKVHRLEGVDATLRPPPQTLF